MRQDIPIPRVLQTGTIFRRAKLRLLNELNEKIYRHYTGKLKFGPHRVNVFRDHGTLDGQFAFLLGYMKFKLLVRLH